METAHEDKSMALEGHKGVSARAREAFARLTANLSLSADEENDVGRRVAVAAENASKPRWWSGMQRAAEPTPAEAAELARCQAAYDKAHIRREETRRAVHEAEVYVFADPGRDLNALIAAQSALVAAEGQFDIACAEVNAAERPLRRARAAILANGARRQRAALPGL